jgi:hypothetical protein
LKKYHIAKGADVSVIDKNNPSEWRKHKTQKDLSFKSYVFHNNGIYTFSHADWIILVKGYWVKKK